MGQQQDITFIFHRDWIENMSKKLDPITKAKIITDIINYGCENELEFCDDPYIESIVNSYRGVINRSKEEYKRKLEMSKVAGRKMKCDNQMIYNLAKQGKKSKEIANELGYSKSTVDHSEGWKRREEDNLIFTSLQN